jgi:hypothetical protein
MEHLMNRDQTRKFIKKLIKFARMMNIMARNTIIALMYHRHKPSDIIYQLTLCIGEDGQIKSEKEELLKRWQEYFQNLLNSPESEFSADSTMKICIN